jgi:hypothetical protein
VCLTGNFIAQIDSRRSRRTVGDFGFLILDFGFQYRIPTLVSIFRCWSYSVIAAKAAIQ